MNSTPSPSRGEALDTSPPLRGGEDTPAAIPTPILYPHEVGERCHGEAVTERGEAPPKSRSRRKPGTTERARSLRWTENEAEGLLWLDLKGRKLGGYHFTRQLPIGPYFADFACRSRKLVVEVDGSQHADSRYDRQRDEHMRRLGYSIFRFWNTDVLKNRTSVCETMLAALDGKLNDDVAAADLRYVRADGSKGASPAAMRPPLPRRQQRQ